MGTTRFIRARVSSEGNEGRVEKAGFLCAGSACPRPEERVRRTPAGGAAGTCAAGGICSSNAADSGERGVAVISGDLGIDKVVIDIEERRPEIEGAGLRLAKGSESMR